jgi:hypothetical protein
MSHLEEINGSPQSDDVILAGDQPPFTCNEIVIPSQTAQSLVQVQALVHQEVRDR